MPSTKNHVKLDNPKIAVHLNGKDPLNDLFFANRLKQ